MSDRRQPRMIAGPMILSGLLVMTTATLAGSPERGPTVAPIAKALVDAHKRGVRVDVILEKDNRTDQYSAADVLANQDVPTKIDAAHAIAHNKIISIDAETRHYGKL